MFYVLNILCLISQSLYILTPCVFAGMKKKGEERKTGCFSVPSFSLRPSISCSVVSAVPFALGVSVVRIVRQRSNQLNQRSKLWRTACIQRLFSLQFVSTLQPTPTVIFLAVGRCSILIQLIIGESGLSNRI